MNIPQNLLYTNEHEWVKIVDNIAIIGITDYAQSELGDIIFVELPSKLDEYTAGDTIGTIEAVKTVADIYAPLAGLIEEVNERLEDEPELINTSPYDEGWIVKIKKSNLPELLSASQYKDLVS